MAIIEHLFIPNLFKRPPNRLDIVVMIGYIRIVHVRPKAYAVAHFLPFALIGENAVFAFFNKFSNALASLSPSPT